MSTVAAVIVSYRSEAAAAAAARAVAAEPDIASITIVDNSAHEQRTENFDLADLADGVEIVRPARNLGYAAGNNVGIRAALEAGHQYVLILNPDIHVPPGTVRALLDELSTTDSHIVSPALLEAQTDGEAVLSRPGFDLVLGRGVLEARAAPRYVPTFFGAAFLARSRTFEQFGPLDEQLFLYCEEIEFVARLRRRGEGHVFHVAHDVVVPHGRGGTVSPGGYGMGSRSTIAYREAARSVVVFGRKYHRFRVWLWILARVAMATRLLPRHPRAATAVVGGIVSGLCSRSAAGRGRP